MYDIILGAFASCFAGFIYALLFWYTQRVDFLKRNLLVKSLIFIGRIGFLVLCLKLTLKIAQIPAIVFMFGFFTAYSMSIFSLQRNV